MSLIELLDNYAVMLRGGHTRKEAKRNLKDMGVKKSVIKAIIHSVDDYGHWMRADGSIWGG